MEGIELASIYRLTAINFRMSSVVLFEDFKRRDEKFLVIGAQFLFII